MPPPPMPANSSFLLRLALFTGTPERKYRRLSAMSIAVVYRSVVRLDNALRQTRSNSLGMESTSCRGGRTSSFLIRSITSRLSLP